MRQALDRTDSLKQRVDEALASASTLEIRGGGSKVFYGRKSEVSSEPLWLAEHRGIVNYAPTELVVSVRAGTSVTELRQALAEQNQQLAFDPPDMHGHATIGGTLATGFSGPSRPWSGAARDHVLGTRILNGRGQVLRFGGEVMKNVAGYDVSRLMVGAMGTLGVILEASLKVLPIPQREVSLTFHLDRDSALGFMLELGSRPLPVSAAMFFGDMVYLRLSGSDTAVSSAMSILGGDELPSSEDIWRGLREFEHPFFKTPLPIWRIALPPGQAPDLPGEVLIDWAGSQWWLRSDAAVESIREPVAAAGGHATLFRGGDRLGAVFHPLDPAMAALQERVRLAFDPRGIFNPGRMTPPSGEV